MLVFLCSCKSETTEEESTFATEITTAPVEVSTEAALPEPEEVQPSDIITVYFSHNDPVKAAAEYINELTKGEIYKIETLGVYPENEAELVKQAAEEHSKNVRPALKNAPLSLSGYDVVFLCFPEWDNTMPMALFTFVEDYDMRDKAVIPVIYGDRAALDNAVRDIHSLEPSMMIVNGYHFASDFSEEKGKLDSWINTVLYGE